MVSSIRASQKGKDSLKINDYIIGQIKRKIEPLYMKKVMRYRSEDGSAFITNASQEINHIAIKNIEQRTNVLTDRSKEKNHKACLSTNSQITFLLTEPQGISSE